MSSVNRKPQVRPQKASRTAARDIVIASRAAGMSLEECAKAAAVSLKTASRYVAEARNASGDLSRDRIISMLSLRLSSPGTPDQYIAPLVAILSKLKGWTDKEQQVERVMPMGDLFASWAAEIASNVGAPTMPHSETVGVSEPVGPNAGEPPIGGVVGSVKSSPPPAQKIKKEHHMVKSGPGEGRVMCSEAPPSAAGTEGYALSICGGLDSVEESGLKGGAGSLPDRNGFEGANEQGQSKAVGK